MSTTRTFTRQELCDLDLPRSHGTRSGCTVISNELIDNDRWSVIYDLIFQLDGQPEDEAWCVCYRRGATEYQDEAPWENEPIVEAALLRRVQKLVTVWE
jgi:hypothetical protein